MDQPTRRPDAPRWLKVVTWLVLAPAIFVVIVVASLVLWSTVSLAIPAAIGAVAAWGIVRRASVRLASVVLAIAALVYAFAIYEVYMTNWQLYERDNRVPARHRGAR